MIFSRRALWFCIFVFLVCGDLSFAGPPINYNSAKSWVEKTVKTEIPTDSRIYLLGPETVAETYLLNGTPTERETSKCRILPSASVVTVREIWKMIGDLDLKGDWALSVYRPSQPAQAILTVSGRDAFDSSFPLSAGDVVWIRAISSP
jgi:hypothetical protein